MKDLRRIYVYGECHNTNTPITSITTYYMDNSGKELASLSTATPGFNHRTVNTSKKAAKNFLDRIPGGIKASSKMKVKICAKDRKGYIVCSPTTTLNFS